MNEDNRKIDSRSALMIGIFYAPVPRKLKRSISCRGTFYF